MCTCLVLQAKEEKRKHVAKSIPTIYKDAVAGDLLGGGVESGAACGDEGTNGQAGNSYVPTRAQRGQAAVIDPTGKYAAGAAAAAAERRSGMTADQVVEVDGAGEEGGGLVVALRDAAGAIPDVLLRVWRSTSAAAVRAAAGKELIKRGVHAKTVSRLLFSGKFLRDEDCLVGVVVHACMDVAACLCQSSNLTRCCCSQLGLCACAYIVSSQMEALESATSQKGSKGLDTRPVLSFFLSLSLSLSLSRVCVCLCVLTV